MLDSVRCFSERRMPTAWQRQTRASISAERRNASSTLPGDATTVGNSPCPGFSANPRSPCSVYVGTPVDGPDR